ncbi:hypothetical protein GCM10009077_21660 [Roseibium denhamense]
MGLKTSGGGATWPAVAGWTIMGTAAVAATIRAVKAILGMGNMVVLSGTISDVSVDRVQGKFLKPG